MGIIKKREEERKKNKFWRYNKLISIIRKKKLFLYYRTYNFMNIYLILN